MTLRERFLSLIYDEMTAVLMAHLDDEGPVLRPVKRTDASVRAGTAVAAGRRLRQLRPPYVARAISRPTKASTGVFRQEPAARPVAAGHVHGLGRHGDIVARH